MNPANSNRTSLQRSAHWFNSEMIVIGIIILLSDLRPVPQGGIHAWYCTPDREPVATTIYPEGAPTSVVLFNGHGIRLPSKY